MGHDFGRFNEIMKVVKYEKPRIIMREMINGFFHHGCN